MSICLIDWRPIKSGKKKRRDTEYLLKIEYQVEGTEYRQSKLDFKHTLVSSDKEIQSTLDDYLLRSATLKASLVTVRKAIKSLPKLDTAESIKARAKLESELQTVTEDTAG
jgi:hypothetical protein